VDNGWGGIPGSGRPIACMAKIAAIGSSKGAPGGGGSGKLGKPGREGEGPLWEVGGG
jgi:hypothetical protein